MCLRQKREAGIVSAEMISCYLPAGAKPTRACMTKPRGNRHRPRRPSSTTFCRRCGLVEAAYHAEPAAVVPPKCEHVSVEIVLDMATGSRIIAPAMGNRMKRISGAAQLAANRRDAASTCDDAAGMASFAEGKPWRIRSCAAVVIERSEAGVVYFDGRRAMMRHIPSSVEQTECFIVELSKRHEGHGG